MKKSLKYLCTSFLFLFFSFLSGFSINYVYALKSDCTITPAMVDIDDLAKIIPPQKYDSTLRSYLATNIYNSDDIRKGLYCNCPYDTIGGPFDISQCAPKLLRVKAHFDFIDFEHVVTAKRMGTTFQRQGQGHKPRSKLQKVDLFNLMESDPYNLFPAEANMNANRKNDEMGESLPPKSRKSIENCQFKRLPAQSLIEPPDHSKGIIARTYLYMSMTYPDFIKLSEREIELFKRWEKDHQVTEWECSRYKKIRQFFINRPDNIVMRDYCLTQK